ncbi:polyhydroxyalkanoate synthesis regulator DNA-binding domain-containing protein [Desulfococcaceae bacterium HSG9]|nr:polyhydroxyalkanoate synthesis regulator DNA-binding domain-containing protein [Desulfococcaceae bacterium HSG9]
MMHKIKRYANRKLYDTVDKKYITLTQLTAMIKEGVEIYVIDNQTGDDITASVLAKMIAHGDKEAGENLSAGALMRLIRKGGDTVADYAKKYTSIWQSALSLAEDETDKLVNKLVKDRELSKSEGRNLKKEIISYTENLKSWIGTTIDKRIKEILGVMNLADRQHIVQLTDTIDALSEKVEELEKRLKKTSDEN